MKFIPLLLSLSHAFAYVVKRAPSLDDPSTQAVMAEMSISAENANAILASKSPRIYRLIPDVLEQAMLQEQVPLFSNILSYPQLIDWQAKSVRYQDGYVMSAQTLIEILDETKTTLTHYPNEAEIFASFISANKQYLTSSRRETIYLLDRAWDWAFDSESNTALETFLSHDDLIEKMDVKTLSDAVVFSIQNDRADTFNLLVSNNVLMKRITNWDPIFDRVFVSDFKDFTLKSNGQQPNLLKFILLNDKIMASLSVKNLETVLKGAAKRNDYTVMNLLLSNDAATKRITAKGYHRAVQVTLKKKDRSRSAENIAYLYLTKPNSYKVLAGVDLGDMLMTAADRSWEKVIYELAQYPTLARIPDQPLADSMIKLVDNGYFNLVAKLMLGSDAFAAKLANEVYSRVFIEAVGQQRMEIVSEYRSRNWMSKVKYSDIAIAVRQVIRNEDQFGKNSRAGDFIRLLVDDSDLAHFNDKDVSEIYKAAVTSTVTDTINLILDDTRITGRVPISVIKDSREHAKTDLVKKKLKMILQQRGVKTNKILGALKDSYDDAKASLKKLLHINNDVFAKEDASRFQENPLTAGAPNLRLVLDDVAEEQEVRQTNVEASSSLERISQPHSPRLSPSRMRVHGEHVSIPRIAGI